MRLRHAVAPAWLALRRARRAIAGPVDGGGFRILLMHDVPESRWPALDALVEHLRRRHGVIAPGEAAALIAGGEAAEVGDGRTPCLLSFDDGFASNLAAGRRLSERHDVRALFFICPGLMDLDAEAQRRRIAADIFDGRSGAVPLPSGMRLLDWSEAAALRDMGHELGAHTMTHRRLSTLDGDALAAEVGGSGRRIAEELDVEVSWFAYPFGDIDSISADALAVVGRHYRFCRSGIRGVNRPGVHRLALTADHVDLAAVRAWSGLILDGALDARYEAQRARLAEMVAGASASAAA